MNSVPRVESTQIIAQINMLLELLRSRGHEIEDSTNNGYFLDRVEYDKESDEFYCYFREEE